MAVFRFGGPGVAEADTWTQEDGGWTSCYLNTLPSLAAAVCSGVEQTNNRRRPEDEGMVRREDEVRPVRILNVKTDAKAAGDERPDLDNVIRALISPANVSDGFVVRAGDGAEWSTTRRPTSDWHSRARPQGGGGCRDGVTKPPAAVALDSRSSQFPAAAAADQLGHACGSLLTGGAA